MADEPQQPEEVPATPEDESENKDATVTPHRVRFAGKNGEGRSLSLYAVLGLGVGALLVLLAIIYFSALDRDNPEQPICTAIDPAAAQQAILDGDVKRVVVNYDKSAVEATDAHWGPVLARIDYVDGGCGNLPQGIAERNAMALVLGTIYLYNETTNQPQIEIKLQASDNLSSSLFTLPTQEPTAMPPATATPEETAATAEAPTPTAPVIGPVLAPGGAASPEAASTPAATPESSAAASPEASPRAEGTPAATATATSTPAATSIP
ncbi:MAG: hypothetical protein WBA63_16570 [Thermomicrobiales bacterium]